VPYIFVKGALIGGCDKLQEGLFDGSLAHVLGAAPGSAAQVSAPDRCGTSSPVRSSACLPCSATP
jgi:hypothetical protein